MARVTVIGGGLAGLVAAIECAEAGAPVRLLEARSSLGGRASTTPGGFAANLGPHAFYTGPLWAWLAERDLHRPFRRPRSPAVRMRWKDSLRRTPPAELRSVWRLRNRPAPVDVSLRDWITAEAGSAAADAVSGLSGVLTFDHDPGRLSAAFVWDKVGRVTFGVPPVARYVVGGWGSVVGHLEGHARRLGVQIETGAKVDDLDEVVADGPVIVATGPRATRALTGDEALRVETPRVVLLDLGLTEARHDPYLISDLDEGAFVNRVTAVDRTVAPPSHSLVQASVGQRPGETLEAGVARLEHTLDLGFPGWRDPRGLAPSILRRGIHRRPRPARPDVARPPGCAVGGRSAALRRLGGCARAPGRGELGIGSRGGPARDGEPRGPPRRAHLSVNARWTGSCQGGRDLDGTFSAPRSS